MHHTDNTQKRITGDPSAAMRLCTQFVVGLGRCTDNPKPRKIEIPVPDNFAFQALRSPVHLNLFVRIASRGLESKTNENPARVPF